MLLDHLTTESRNPASERLDALSPIELVRLMNEEDASVAVAVGKEAESIARAIEGISDRMKNGGRLIYVGAGTSGRLGVLDAAECPPTFNSDPRQVVGVIAGGSEALVRAIEGAEDSPEQGAEDLAGIGLEGADAVVGIATSGRTPYVLGALEYARKQGCFTAAIACNRGAEVALRADVPIVPIVGPEILSGSTRLKAGTATKMVLNILSTGAMVRLGKTFGNLMVDLRATNEKLRARTVRIVTATTGVSAGDAQRLLDRCGGELKTAIVAERRGVSPAEARRLLSGAGGRLRNALDAEV
ncbi:MAG TPA: N-acetylmuramic acid 6-phosphate etherase [Planctomycetia bacterium]|nr:N-acetylmuramic acid 6-phosphate etherase [Planctomycetia bacterium]